PAIYPLSLHDALPICPATELALSLTSSPPRLCLHYATELFDRASAEAMAEDLDLLLRDAATAEDRPAHETLAGETAAHIEQIHPSDPNQEIHPGPHHTGSASSAQARWAPASPSVWPRPG